MDRTCAPAGESRPAITCRIPRGLPEGHREQRLQNGIRHRRAASRPHAMERPSGVDGPRRLLDQVYRWLTIDHLQLTRIQELAQNGCPVILEVHPAPQLASSQPPDGSDGSESGDNLECLAAGRTEWQLRLAHTHALPVWKRPALSRYLIDTGPREYSQHRGSPIPQGCVTPWTTRRSSSRAGSSGTWPTYDEAARLVSGSRPDKPATTVWRS